MDFKLLAGASGGAGGLGDAAQATALGIDTGLFPSLTMKQRLWGFGICFGVGMLCSLLSSGFLVVGNYISFGIVYSFGNMLSMFSTALLFGPKRQLKNMFHEKRRIATLLYFLSLAGTLGVAFGVSGLGSVRGTNARAFRWPAWGLDSDRLCCAPLLCRRVAWSSRWSW